MVEPQKTDIPAGSSDKAAGKKSEEELPFEEAHNCCAFLGDVKKHTEFTGIIEFLKRSRVVDAIATPAIIYKDLLQEFWTNAKMDFWECESSLVSKIQGQLVIVSENDRSEEHTSELQSRVDISYAVFCLKK